MKAQSVTKKSYTEINLHQILALPHEEFLPQVFWALMGRDPDPFGLLHYASRLNKKISRTQIMVEMRSSEEGMAQAHAAPCRELDALMHRYRFLKKLPLGQWRWRFLPRLEPLSVMDGVFHWERWAVAYINPPASTIIPTAIEQQIRGLEAEMEKLRGDFRESAARLVTQGALAEALAPPQQALNSTTGTLIPAEQVPWVARQSYHLLMQSIKALM